MKLLTLLPTALLAATTYASEDASAASASAAAAAASSAAANDPTPAGALWTAKWDTVSLQPYQQHCLNRNTYTARIYKLSESTFLSVHKPEPSDLMPP
jgi:hypothetical protein